ncbi:MAG: Asp-tRNA(Asn)/Glu-tRNA(Gln) amidotransferase subunit GatC [Planctomycetota bacterium]|nr:Asp-tRNA(Asn)/Glu-tRNA(Gln) amidotransferase subunit GatC [Planctomycetota bacterium]
MTTGIESKDVLKVAKLAKLQLTEEEVKRLGDELSQIVGYVDQLSSVDTTNVAPLDHVLDVTDALRDDTVISSLPRESALSNAPKEDGETFLVPPVLG